MNFEINKHVLLTGSGFTKNFGGFLANEIYQAVCLSEVFSGSETVEYKLINDFFDKIWAEKVNVAEELIKSDKYRTEGLIIIRCTWGQACNYAFNIFSITPARMLV